MLNTNNMDKVAIGLSVLCAIHCLLLPVILITLPTMSATLIGDEQFHFLLLFVIVPVSFFALIMGCKKHQNFQVVMCGLFGLSILGIAQILGCEIFGELGEKSLTMCGTLFIVFSHIQNFRLCRQQRCENC